MEYQLAIQRSISPPQLGPGFPNDPVQNPVEARKETFDLLLQLNLIAAHPFLGSNWMDAVVLSQLDFYSVSMFSSTYGIEPRVWCELMAFKEFAGMQVAKSIYFVEHQLPPCVVVASLRISESSGNLLGIWAEWQEDWDKTILVDRIIPGVHRAVFDSYFTPHWWRNSTPEVRARIWSVLVNSSPFEMFKYIFEPLRDVVCFETFYANKEGISVQWRDFVEDMLVDIFEVVFRALVLPKLFGEVGVWDMEDEEGMREVMREWRDGPERRKKKSGLDIVDVPIPITHPS